MSVTQSCAADPLSSFKGNAARRKIWVETEPGFSYGHFRSFVSLTSQNHSNTGTAIQYATLDNAQSFFSELYHTHSLGETKNNLRPLWGVASRQVSLLLPEKMKKSPRASLFRVMTNHL